MKQCKKCRQTLQRSLFSKDKHSKDGLKSICKACQRAVNKKYYQENKDTERARKKQYYHQDSGLRRHQKAVRRGFKSCTCCKEEDIIDFYRKTPCGKEVDHIIELWEGGLHCVKNFQYLTRSENSSKHRKKFVDKKEKNKYNKGEEDETVPPVL